MGGQSTASDSDVRAFEIEIRDAPQTARKRLEDHDVAYGFELCVKLIQKAKALGPLERLMSASNLSRFGRSGFVLQLATTGSMPQGLYAIRQSEYTQARIQYLTLLDDSRTMLGPVVGLWTGSQQSDVLAYRRSVAKTVCFYPEYENPYASLRDRVCRVAQDHSSGGPHEPAQIALFSLGGRYGYANARAGTSPTGLATTCMLTVRSIWHAAGINVSDRALTTCVINGSLAKELEPMNAYVTVHKGETLSSVHIKPGDIFQIDDPPKQRLDTDGKLIGAAHVGVFLGAKGPGAWDVVQGGAGDHRTVRRAYTVLPSLVFEDDQYTWGARRLVGYWSLDRVGSGFLI